MTGPVLREVRKPARCRHACHFIRILDRDDRVQLGIQALDAFELLVEQLQRSELALSQKREELGGGTQFWRKPALLIVHGCSPQDTSLSNRGKARKRPMAINSSNGGAVRARLRLKPKGGDNAMMRRITNGRHAPLSRTWATPSGVRFSPDGTTFLFATAERLP